MYTVTKAGQYNATAMKDGCSHSDEISIEYSVTEKIDLGQDTVLCNGSTLTLELDPSRTYYWNDGSSNNSKTVNAPVDLWVNSLAGNCSSTDSLTVDFVDCEMRLPNFFSPNEDEYNQYLIPSEMSGIHSAKLSVYNRWGNELYYTDDFSFSNGWDGKYQGKPLSAGTYFWKVKYIDIEGNANTLKGIVTLQR